MKRPFQIEITFDQILSLVKQLPREQKLELTRELEKEAIDSKLSSLLRTFRTKDLDLKNISQEVELVRQESMTNKSVKVIFDTNVWISFLIGKRLPKIKQHILTLNPLFP